MGTAYILLGLAILTEIVGTVSLKASDGMTRLIPGTLVVAGYAASFYLMALALKTLPVGSVYAIWSGLGIVGVAIAGALLFGESVTGLKLAGMALIISGVVLIKFGTP